MNPFISIPDAVPASQFIAIGTHKTLGEVTRVATPNGRFYIKNSNDFCKSRAIAFYSKEPCTISYIDALPKPDMFIDVGANIGVYSMYALAEGMSRVVAIEPSVFNYHELFLNRLLNDKNQRCFPINAAVADGTHALELLSLNGTKAGHSFNQVGETDSNRPIQPVMTLPLAELDRLRDGRATHIKIDVDGIEGRIVEHIKDVIEILNVRSIQVEFDQNKPATQKACQALFDLGFVTCPEQMAFRREGLLNLDEVQEKYARAEHIGNVLFSRDEALFSSFKTFF